MKKGLTWPTSWIHLIRYHHYRIHEEKQHRQCNLLPFSLQLDAKGCFSEVVNTKLFQLKQSGYASTIKIEGKITEEGTGILAHNNTAIWIRDRQNTMFLVHPNTWFWSSKALRWATEFCSLFQNFVSPWCPGSIKAQHRQTGGGGGSVCIECPVCLPLHSLPPSPVCISYGRLFYQMQCRLLSHY